MCRAIVFRLVPTSLEIVAVVSVLSRMFRPEVGAIVAATSLTYIAFTAAMTQVRCPLCPFSASTGAVPLSLSIAIAKPTAGSAACCANAAWPVRLQRPTANLTL
jgi:hypothetical protein